MMLLDRIAAVVTLYNPQESVVENIETYRKSVDILYVIDNAPDKSVEVREKIKDNKNVEYIDCIKNIGVAAALNIAAKKAINLKYNYLLTMDQDSFFYKVGVEKLLTYIQDQEHIGLVTPYHYDRNAPRERVQTDPEFVPVAITSGSILNLNAYLKVGGFLDSLFIDYVDIEFCLRLRKYGYNILRVNEVVLSHALGHFTPKYFFGKQVYPENHNAVRYYYQTRNRLYVNKLYRKTFPFECKTDIRLFVRTVIKILLYENERLKKIKMIVKGMTDYLLNKFPIIEP